MGHGTLGHVVKNWKHRWFVIKKDTMYYFKSKKVRILSNTHFSPNNFEFATSKCNQLSNRTIVVQGDLEVDNSDLEDYSILLAYISGSSKVFDGGEEERKGIFEQIGNNCIGIICHSGSLLGLSNPCLE